MAAIATWGCDGCSGHAGDNGTTGNPSGTHAGSDGGDDGGAAGTLEGGASTDGGASTEGGADSGTTALATVHFLGRFDNRDAAGPRFAWPGSAIAATFNGTGLQIALTDSGTNFFSVVVDGGMPTVLATAGPSKTYTLASNLAPGQHSVVFTKRTESNVGVVQYLGFTVTGGALVPSPAPFTRRIEYVGDSISCGYGDLGVGPGCHFDASTEDETIAYDGLTAAALDAEQTVIAYSGKGMVRDLNDNTANQMPLLWTRALADDATSTWAFDAPDPDVVVIDLGTNDFAMGDPGSAFEQAYEAFLRALRAHYPSAFVIATASPMLGDPSRATSIGYIEKAVGALVTGGDERVTVLEVGGNGAAALDGGGDVGFDVQLAINGYGCDYHPSTKTHTVMSSVLVPAIRHVTGW
jgi:lysophospholipase L1-like esterase